MMPTITELSVRAGRLALAMSAKSGLNHFSSMVFGLASGLDVGITLLEESTGAFFSGLTSDKAASVVEYFHEEAARSEAVDPQIAIFYRAWAQVLSDTYLDK